MSPTPKKKRPGRPAEPLALRKGHRQRLHSALTAIYGGSDRINQSDAARKSGLSPGRINDVLNEERALGRQDLFALARGLRISADYLLGVEGAPMFVGQKFNEDLDWALAHRLAVELTAALP